MLLLGTFISNKTLLSYSYSILFYAPLKQPKYKKKKKKTVGYTEDFYPFLWGQKLGIWFFNW